MKISCSQLMYLIVSFFFLITPNTQAQTSKNFTYQIVIRNYENELIKNANISLRISILQGSYEGETVYIETKNTTTNENGLATIEVGAGQSDYDISDIEWDSDDYFIMTEFDPDGGTSFIYLNINQILSAPYALYSETTESISQSLEPGLYYWSGDKWEPITPGKNSTALILCNGIPTWGGCDNYDSPIFVVSNKDSINVLSISEKDVTINVFNEDNKSARGSFAVGGFTTNKELPSEIFLVGHDSIRVYIKTEEETKNALSGFGVNHIISGKDDISDDYFKVTSDTTYFYKNLIAKDDIKVEGDIEIDGTIIYRPSLQTLSITINDLVEFKGNVSYDGGGTITKAGFFLGFTQTPEADGQELTADYVENTPFTATIDYDELIAGAPYYVRAFARNRAGVGYGQVFSFNTDALLAEIITSEITDITSSTATSGGEVVDDGGASVTSRGVVWNISENPSLTENINYTNNGSGTGIFISNLTELQPSTTYYLRAYATNASGTAYGEQLSFTTEIDMTPIPVHFFISDYHTGETIENAQINIAEDELFTDSEGHANISLSQGTYEYSVEADNYILFENELTVTFDMDTVEVKLLPSEYEAIFLVIDSTNDNPVENAEILIVIDQDLTETIITDFEGITTISLPEGNYQFYVTAEEFDILEDEISIGYGIDTLVINLNPILYNVEFIVINNNTIKAIEAATISIDSEELVTDQDGYAEIDLRYGEYQVVVTAEGFESFENSILVSEDTEIATIELEPIIEYIYDIDGNQYLVIEIGTQKWMQSNLRVTNYNDGEGSITETISAEEWEYTKEGAYAIYPYSEITGFESNADMVNAYGKLYNWHAANSDMLCPLGWRVPTYNDWSELNSFLQVEYSVSDTGGLLKDTLIDPEPHPRWDLPNEGATNESGFTGLPAGLKTFNGEYWDIGAYGSWWTAGNPDNFRLGASNDFLTYSEGVSQNIGVSVRCIWNNGLPKVKRPVMASEEVIDDVILSSVVVDAGGLDEFPLISRGFVLGLDTLPTVENGMFFKELTNEIGTYTGVVPGLEPGQVYHARAFAENELGIYYSGGIKLDAFTLKDIGNRKYDIVKIGEQYWMKRNLEISSYNNGQFIEEIDMGAAHETKNQGIPYLIYNDMPGDNAYDFGLNYSYTVVDDDNFNVCPVGWKVPDINDWDILIAELGGAGVAGGKMKTTDTDDSDYGNGYWKYIVPATATNESGFSAVPAGWQCASGYFYGIYSATTPGAHFWSTTTQPVDIDKFRKTTIYLSYDTEAVTYSYATIHNSTGGQDGLSIRCVMHTGDPIVSTLRINNVTMNSAKSGGTVIFERGHKPEESGIVWSTNPNPTVEINEGISTNQISRQEFICNMQDLEPDTRYFVRAFVVIQGETFYGNELEFKTFHSVVKDYEDNEYYTVNIGERLWMAENLKVTLYNNGDEIEEVLTGVDWQSIAEVGAYTYHYFFDESIEEYVFSLDTHGALYNWYAVNDERGICPPGWHVPTVTEWRQMIKFIDPDADVNTNIAGGKLKSNSLIPDKRPRWLYPNYGASNSSGFSAIPGGRRDGWNGNLQYFGSDAYYWTSSDSTSGAFSYNLGYLNKNTFISESYKSHGMSARCIKTVLSVEDFIVGSGSEEEPYQVANAAQLNNVRNFPEAYFVQTSNINLGVWPWTELGWEPIGDEEIQFTGNFDGREYTISGLTINKPEDDYVGLFGYLSSAVIDSIGLVEVYIHGNNYVGGLAGYVENSIINTCFTQGSVEGNNFVGGFAGVASSTAAIYNSYAITDVYGADEIGGLIGRSYAGGDIGVIDGCYSIGNVTGNIITGGFVGDNILMAVIKNSYSTGSVTRNGGISNSFGGFAGRNEGEIYNCYSTGKVFSAAGVVWNEGGSNNKGFLGEISGVDYHLQSNFWDIYTSGQAFSDGATGLTTDEMLLPENFLDGDVSFDFDNTWSIISESTYPYLTWQNEPGEHNYPEYVELIEVEITVESEIGSPIEGALVNIYGFTEVTDESGIVVLLLPVGQHNILITAIFYHSYDEVLEVFDEGDGKMSTTITMFYDMP